MENKVKIGLIIMASGLGRRYGGNKLMVPLKGRPLIQWAMDATEGVFDQRLVVTRYAEVKDLCDRQNIECILHDYPGQNDTIRLGLAKLQGEMDVCFFLPGDQPLISKQTLMRLLDYAREHSDKIVRSCFGDVVGSPVGFPKFLYPELLSLPQDMGGSKVVRNHPEIVKTISVDAEYELWDIDMEEDIIRIDKVLKF